MGLAARLGYHPRQAGVYAILLSAPVLLSLYRYQGSPARFAAWFPGLASHPAEPLLAVLFSWSVFFLLVFALPLAASRWGMRLDLADLGMTRGDLRAGLAVVAWALPLVVVPVALLSSHLAPYRAEYPLARILFSRPDLVPGYEAAYAFLYYLAWEFYFRGFLLFPLARALGGVNAILIQTVSSCLVHIGKPEGEVLGSIVAGVALGALALRTGSFFYGWVLHAALGVLLDLFILFG